MKKEPVVIVFTVLAVLQVLSGGLALVDNISKDTAAIFSLIVGALTAGASFYVRAMVTPWDQVVSKLADNGHVVTGPAAETAPPPPGPATL